LLWINNIDLENSVRVDSSITFDKFPQVIGPGLGVYLSTLEAGNIYAKAETGTATIEILAAL
jgi:hypothetical protein